MNIPHSARSMAGKLTAELAAHGVSEYTITRGRHHKLRFTYNGKPLLYVFSVSPSDRCAEQNALRDLRKLLGVKKAVRKTGANSRKHRVTARTSGVAVSVADQRATLADKVAELRRAMARALRLRSYHSMAFDMHAAMRRSVPA